VNSTYPTHEDVLRVLHAQGSKWITLEVLEAHTRIERDWLTAEGGDETYPRIGFNNGVSWFFDKDRRPDMKHGSGKQKTHCAGGVRRTLLGDLEKDTLILFEGERDWLTALSLGFDNAICAGGILNLDEHQFQQLAQKAEVVVFFDNDEEGVNGAKIVAARLQDHGCLAAKWVVPPIDGDFSEWVEGFEDDPRGTVLHRMTSQAERLKKADAKKILNAGTKAKKKDDIVEHPSDEFTTSSGDLVTSVWRPTDPEHPHHVDLGGKAVFVRHDLAASEKAGSLIVDYISRYTEAPTETDEFDEVPEIYGGGQRAKSHAPDRPPVVVPLGGQTVSDRIMVLPSGAREHGSSEKLWDDVVELIEKYFVCAPAFVHAMAAYTFLTYRYRDARFEVIPYLRVIGQAGSGKTRFARIMKELCFRSLFVTGMRSHHIYRIITGFNAGATLVFEEFDMGTRGEEKMEWTRILNAGNQYGVKIPRMGGKNFSDVEYFDIFGPKVISMHEEFDDEGLARRCFGVVLGKMEVPKEKYFAALPNIFYQETAILRERLLGWRFAKRGLPTRTLGEELQAGIKGEVWQTVFPMLAMVPAARPEATAAILGLAQKSQAQMKLVRATSPVAQVLESTIYAHDDDRGWTELQNVLTELQLRDPNARWTTQKVNKCLREAGLTPRRTMKKIGEHIWVVDIDDTFRGAVATYKLEIEQLAQENARETAPQEIM